MKPPDVRPRLRQLVRLLAVGGPILFAVPVTRAIAAGDWSSAFGNPVAPAAPRAELVNVPTRRAFPAALSVDSLQGRSGHLRAAFLTRDDVEALPALLDRFGPEMRLPGVRTIALGRDTSTFAFVTLKPWREKLGSFINTYHVGWWPGERRTMPENYDNPIGFIEVTPEIADLRLSTHFTLRSFITHDQERIWPKYVVMREELLDKLELVLTTLQAQGIPTRHVKVLSGFRTPQYNQRGVGAGGRAPDSRHQYGDAADVYVDNDGDGRMDDLNRDGRVSIADARLLAAVVDQVEQRHGDLTGGVGIYAANSVHGPFVHVDVRGTRARW